MPRTRIDPLSPESLLDEHEREFVKGRRGTGVYTDDELLEGLRQYRAIQGANKAQLSDEPSAQVRPPDVPPKRNVGPYEQQYAYWDQLMALDERLSRALEDYDRRGPGITLNAQKAKAALARQQAELRNQFIKDRDDFDLGPAYQQWHKERFEPAQEEAAPSSGPGFLERLWGGAKSIGKGVLETGEFALRHPQRAAENVQRGVEQFGSLPGRVVESLIMGEGKEFPIASPKRWLREKMAGTRQADIEAGVPEESVGPEVTRAVGGAVIPAGPTLKSGQLLKNVLKGGGWSGGLDVAERVASDEPITLKGVGTSTVVGGGLAGLFGKMLPKPRNEFQGPLERYGPPGPGESGGPSPKPRGIGYLDPQPGEVRGGVVYGAPPPKALPAPQQMPPAGSQQLEVPQVWKERVQAAWRSESGEIFFQLPSGEIKSAGTVSRSTQLSVPEGPVQERGGLQRILDTQREMKSRIPVEPTTPPSGAGRIEAPGSPVAARASMAGEELATPPKSPSYPGSIYGMPGVKPPEAPAAPPVASKMKKPIGVTNAPVSSAPEKAKTPLAKSIDEAIGKSEAEAELGTILRGEKDVREIPVSRGVSPKAEAPVEAKASKPIPAGALSKDIEPEPALGKVAKGKTELPTKRVEEFIKDQGYTIRERQPFPGETEYDVIDPKSGNVIARGDRAVLTEALSGPAKEKGVKLYSFPGDLSSIKDELNKVLEKVGAKTPEGVGVEGRKATQSFGSAVLQPFETPGFLFRKYAPAKSLVDEAAWTERVIEKRVKDLIYRETPEGFQKTKLFTYFELPEKQRAVVDKALVYGDRVGIELSRDGLMRQGLSTNQIDAYEGVREALKRTKDWVGMEADIPGYIPRVWHGNLEIYRNGSKYIKPDGSSTFGTLREASAEAYKLKQTDPTATLNIKFYADPDFLGGRAFQDAQLVSRLKRNLESMGSLAAGDIDRAYESGRTLKGFTKHLETRMGETGYETEGLDKVLFNYFHQAAKHVEINKLKEAMNTLLKEHRLDLTDQQVHYLQNYVERVAGRPTWDQIAIHNFIGSTPIGRWLDPVSGSKFLKDVRQLTTHLTLGMGNLSWAAINVDTLIRHVWPALQREGSQLGPIASERFLSGAVKEFFQNKALRQKLAHHGVIDIQHMSEVLPQVGHTFGKGEWSPARVSMALGTATEEFVRGVSAIARYRMALAQGMDDLSAMKSAARFVDSTSGRYTRAGKPAAYTGAIGETVGMFKTYMSVFMENAFQAFSGASKNPGTLIRYMMATMGVGGLLSLPGIDDLDEVFTRNMGWSPIESMQKHLPKGVLTGIASVAPGAAGYPGFNVDLSKRSGVPEVVPDDLKSALGPVVGRYGQVVGDLLQGEGKQAVLDLLPNSIKGAVSVIRGLDKGVSMGRLDKPISKIEEPGEAFVKGLGFPPAREVEDIRDYVRLKNLSSYRETELRSLAHKIQQGSASEKDREKFRELRGTSKHLKNEAERERKTLTERQFKHLPKVLRMREDYD